MFQSLGLLKQLINTRTGLQKKLWQFSVLPIAKDSQNRQYWNATEHECVGQTVSEAFVANPHESARSIVTNLTQAQRRVLHSVLVQAQQQDSLKEFQKGGAWPTPWSLLGGSEGTKEVELETSVAQETPSMSILYRMALFTGLPMVAFGFMDNFIMIVMGESIDSSLCLWFGLSTMVAAGIGNLISDVAGLFFADYFGESIRASNAIKEPRLSRAQTRLFIVMFARVMGQVIGVSIGCIIGLCPVLFYGFERQDHEGECSA